MALLTWFSRGAGVSKKRFDGVRLCGEFKYIVHKHIQQAANGTGLAADQVRNLGILRGIWPVCRLSGGFISDRSGLSRGPIGLFQSLEPLGDLPVYGHWA